LCFVVPVAEAGFPIPDGPAEAFAFGGAAEFDVVADAGFGVGAGVAAEFADVDGAVVALGPFTGGAELADERMRAGGILRGGQGVVVSDPGGDGLVAGDSGRGSERSLRRAGEDDAAGVGSGPGPGRALVCEVKRIVAMHGDNDVGVVGGKDEVWEFLDLVPAARAKEDCALGIGFADLFDGFGVNGIHDGGGGFVFRLVDELEGEAGTRGGVMDGDLTPDGIIGPCAGRARR
jgi:hypothetical protein